MPEINIVYGHGPDQHQLIYSGEEGKVWQSRTKRNDLPNIAVSNFSIPNPSPEDSLFIIEPRSVISTDYDINFVNQFKKVFTWAVKPFHNTIIQDKLVEVNYPSLGYGPSDNTIRSKFGTLTPSSEALVKYWKPWGERRNEIVIVANNKSSSHYTEIYSLRNTLAEVFRTNLRSTVSWYGQTRVPAPYYRGLLNDKIEYLNNVRFALCSENTYDEVFSYNYLTEKLMDVIIGGAVPLYMGCYNIDDFGLPEGSYIDLRKFVTKSRHQINVNQKALVDYLHSFNEEMYLSGREKLMKLVDDEKFYRRTTMDSVCRAMLKY